MCRFWGGVERPQGVCSKSFRLGTTRAILISTVQPEQRVTAPLEPAHKMHAEPVMMLTSALTVGPRDDGVTSTDTAYTETNHPAPLLLHRQQGLTTPDNGLPVH